MKRLLHIQIFVLIYISFSTSGFSQNYSPLYGKDIIINDNPEQNQQLVSISSAGNGWIYSVYAYPMPNNDTRIVFSKSVDNGITWNIIKDFPWYATNMVVHKIKLLVTGNTTENIYLYVATAFHMPGDTSLNASWVNVYKYDFNGNYIEYFIETKGYDVDIATDSWESTPERSLSILIAENSPPANWIVYFLKPGDQPLKYSVLSYSTSIKYHKVSASFGQEKSTGEKGYFFAWEEQDNLGSMPGRIFTSHTMNGIDTPMTAPVRLDNLVPGGENMCSSPVISCQRNVYKNDSSGITSVVVFEKKNQSTGTYEVTGVSNLQSLTSSYYTPIIIDNQGMNNKEPDLCFNKFDSSFYLTYYNVTEKKLPLLKADYNLPSQSEWETITTGYNDSTDISNPFPCIAVNFLEEKVVNAWTADGDNGNGMIMFDSQYSTWTGSNNIPDQPKISVWPNPCINELNISYNQVPSKIKVYNLIGVPVAEYETSDQNSLRIDMTELPSGIYFVELKYSDFQILRKIVKN